MRAFLNGRLLGWYFGGKGGRGGMWVTGSSGPGRGVATCGTVSSTTGRDVGVGAEDFAGTMTVGRSGADEGSGPEGMVLMLGVRMVYVHDPMLIFFWHPLPLSGVP